MATAFNHLQEEKGIKRCCLYFSGAGAKLPCLWRNCNGTIWLGAAARLSSRLYVDVGRDVGPYHVKLQGAT